MTCCNFAVSSTSVDVDDDLLVFAPTARKAKAAGAPLAASGALSSRRARVSLREISFRGPSSSAKGSAATRARLRKTREVRARGAVGWSRPAPPLSFDGGRSPPFLYPPPRRPLLFPQAARVSGARRDCGTWAVLSRGGLSAPGRASWRGRE